MQCVYTYVYSYIYSPIPAPPISGCRPTSTILSIIFSVTQPRPCYIHRSNL